MYPNNRLSEEKLLRPESGEDDCESPSYRSPSPRRTYHTYLLTFNLILLLISLSTLLSAVHYRSTTKPCDCKDHMPMYSPALEAVRSTGHLQRFDGSFATPNTFKGTPSPDLDAAWDNITYATGGVINISEETLHAVNASAPFSVKLAPEIGGGYMASVEALHQLHCLNMLRKATYEDYYQDKPGPWEDSPQTLRYHLDHCIDNLRQKVCLLVRSPDKRSMDPNELQLMCDADTGILTYVWVKGHEMPFPDFSVQHKCRDFGALKDWVTEHQTYTSETHGIERMAGALELDVPP